MIFATKDITLDSGKSLLIVPFGDIQSASEYGRVAELANWLAEHEQQGHQVILFGMGDYFESPSPSDRAALKAAKRGFGHYDELAKDIMGIYEKRAYEIAERLKPVQDNIAGLLRGHHWVEFVTRLRPDLPDDSNKLLARLLNCFYWGSSAQFTININNMPFKIFASHGYGSARTPGARVTKRIRMREVVLDANWYVMGHDNEKIVYPTQVLVGREYFKQYFAGSGSFQRSYNFDEPEGTYAEDLLLPPSVLGVNICTIKVQHDKGGQPRLDYHISA